MKLYDYEPAPNPRLVRIFLAEKGIEVPREQVDISKGENREDAFLAINPMGGLPVLELDDGTRIAETAAICRYFEALNPEPALMGRDALDCALVEMWRRRMELEVALPIMLCFRNTHEYFSGRYPQFRDYGEACGKQALKRLQWLDGEMASRDYIAGKDYTIADITALIGIDFGRMVDIRLQDLPNLQRWHQRVSARPSAGA